MAGEAKHHNSVHLPFEVSVVRCVVECCWILSVDQCWLQVLLFSVHLIDLLSVFLRCNGFTGIQKAVVDQTGSRPPVTMVFFWCKFGFFRASSRSNHGAGCRQVSYKIHFSLHVTIQLRNSLLLLCTVKEDNTSK